MEKLKDARIIDCEVFQREEKSIGIHIVHNESGGLTYGEAVGV